MKPLTIRIFLRLSFCAAISLVLVSCRSSTNMDQNPSLRTPIIQDVTPATALPDQNSTDAASESSAPSLPDMEALVAGPNPLDPLIDLRSVIIHLSSQKPDGSGNTLQIEIDSAGNMHERGSLPPFPKVDVAQGVELPTMPGNYEIFVVDGKAYAPLELDRNWMSNPVDEDYVPQLATRLHAADGLASWLDLLPAGSLISAGQETVGGFEADKFTVKGSVDGQSITGNLWYEPQSGALVKAELIVPPVLYDGSANGQFSIALDVQKAEVAPITLPEKPD